MRVGVAKNVEKRRQVSESDIDRRGYAKASPFDQSYKGLCRTKSGDANSGLFVIWRIILRDFWCDILRVRAK
jgi:hypothetical protein